MDGQTTIATKHSDQGKVETNQQTRLRDIYHDAEQQELIENEADANQHPLQSNNLESETESNKIINQQSQSGGDSDGPTGTKIVCPFCKLSVNPRVESERNCCKIGDDCFVMSLSCLECLITCKSNCLNRNTPGFRSTFAWHHFWSLQVRQFCPNCGHMIANDIV